MTPLALLAVLWAPAGAAAAGGPGAPCATCVRWELTAAQADALAARSASLEGMALLLPAEAAGTAEGLAAAGASVALRVGPAGLERLPAGIEAVVLGLPGGDSAQRDFALKTAATRLRALQAGLRIGVEAEEDAAPAAYVDFTLGVGAGPPGLPRWRRPAATTVARVLLATSEAAGEVLARWPQGAEPAAPFALAALRGLFGPSSTAQPDVEVACRAEGARVPCAAATFLHEGGDAVVIVEPAASVSEVQLRAARVPLAADTEPARARLHSLEALVAPRPLPATMSAAETRVEVPALATPFVLQIEGWGRAHARFGADVEVVAGRDLTAEEVIARHQAWAAGQARLVPRWIGEGTLAITFQAPGLSAPVTVNAEVTLYAQPGGLQIEQRALRLNGLALGTDGVPRLPIIEPERVASAPLAITLGEAYRYRLDGRARAGGRDCYRLSFTPAAASGPSFRGRAWIDAAGFALVRMEAAQTGLRGPIVSSQQTDEYVAVPHAGATAWLLARTTVHQVYEGPGHRTPIDRVLALRAHQPDPADFERRLLAAHASAAVMLQETPRGFEYLQPARGGGAAGAPGRRVPAGKAAAVRTLALGVLVDPAIGDPLPFAGAGYSDFDFLGSGTQLSAFLAGAFAQVSWSAPSLLGSRFRLQAAGFASLVEYNDRVFHQGVEQYAENLRQRPARLALDVSHPLGPRVRARAGYELAYTRLRRSDLTAAGFREPPSALAHGLRLALDGEKGSWSASAWWRPAWRPRWRAWGFEGALEDPGAARSYQRYGLRLARSAVVSPRLTGRLELAAMAGRGLDRFSRFAFDGFEERLTGYPTATVRFDRGLIARSAFVWQPRPFLRVQAWLDGARVRDAGFDFEQRALWGVGAGLEAPLPLRGLLAFEWGHGLQGRDRDGREGTHTLRLTAYRVF